MGTSGRSALVQIGRRALAVVAIALINAGSACAVHASIIVSWNETRGGASSLADDASYASARAMIAADYPGTTLVGVPTITTASLSGADFVWIGADFGDTSAIAPLSAAEQSALLAFVQGGGTVLLFGENDTYSVDAPTVNNSLFSPFGVHNTGTLSHTQSYTLPSPANFPLSGPFGSVGSLVSNYAGWFDTLPASASVVATLSGNGQPVIADLPKGALGAGSGAVWVFGDSGGQSAGGTDSGDWNTLYANILSQTAVPEPGSAVLVLLMSSTLFRARTSRRR